ncbi:hypothetical protein ACGF5M_06315 [Gemmatimonadota bacterium]
MCRHTVITVSLALVMVGCRPPGTDVTSEHQTAIANTIEQLTTSFLERYDSLNPDLFLEQFSDDMRWGARGGYESASEFASGVRGYMATLVESANAWDQMEIQILGPDVAVVGGDPPPPTVPP